MASRGWRSFCGGLLAFSIAACSNGSTASGVLPDGAPAAIDSGIDARSEDARATVVDAPPAGGDGASEGAAAVDVAADTAIAEGGGAGGTDGAAGVGDAAAVEGGTDGPPPADAAPPSLTFGERVGASHRGVTRDAQLWLADDPTTPLNNEREFRWGGYQGIRTDGDPRIVSLIRIDLAKAAGIKIARAALLLVTQDCTGCESAVPIRLHRVLLPWTEFQVTWFTRNGADDWPMGDVLNGVDLATVTGTFIPAAAGTEYAAPLPAALVQSWIDDPSSNNGLALVVDDGDGAAFYSKEHFREGQRPLLALWLE